MIIPRKFLPGLLGLLLLGGCVSIPVMPTGPRYFWPPFAQQAKIEYLGFYASEANLKGVLFNTLSEAVFGVERARPLFKVPFAVDAWQRRVLVTDSSSRQFYLFDFAKKTVKTFSLASDEGGKVGFPGGAVLLDQEQFLIVDSLGPQVVRFDLKGSILGTFGKERLQRPTGIAIDRQRQRIVVVDTGAHRLAIFSYEGDFLGYLGERGEQPGKFNYPLDADFDTQGNLFVLDSMNFRVQRFDREGQSYRYAGHFGEIGTASGSFERPKSLAVSPSGHVYVTDALGHKVIVFDREGNFLLSFGGQFVATGGQFAPGGFYMPAGIAIDEKEGIWVVDSLNRMVHHFQYLNEDYLREHPILPDQIVPTGL